MRKISRITSAICALVIMGTTQPLAPSWRIFGGVSGNFAWGNLKLKQKMDAAGIISKLNAFFAAFAPAWLGSLDGARAAVDAAVNALAANPAGPAGRATLTTAGTTLPRAGQIFDDGVLDALALGTRPANLINAGAIVAGPLATLLTDYYTAGLNKAADHLSPEYTEDFCMGSFGLSLGGLALMSVSDEFKIGLLLELGWDFGSFTGSLKSSSTPSGTVDKKKVPDYVSLNNGFNAKIGLAVEMYESFVAAAGLSLHNRTFKADKDSIKKYNINYIESEVAKSLPLAPASADYGKLEDQNTLVPGWFLQGMYFFNLNSNMQAYVKVGVFGDLGDTTAKYPVSYKIDVPAPNAFTLEASSANDLTAKVNIGLSIGAGIAYAF